MDIENLLKERRAVFQGLPLQAQILFRGYIDQHLVILQDDLHALAFTQVDDELYCINADTGELVAMNGTEGYPETDDLPWAAEFGTFGYEYEMQKYLSRFNIRLQMSPGAIARMWIQYDSDGVWHEQGELQASTLSTVMIPVIPRRCDHCKIKLTGLGHVRIFSIARVLEIGGDGYAV